MKLFSLQWIVKIGVTVALQCIGLRGGGLCKISVTVDCAAVHCVGDSEVANCAAVNCSTVYYSAVYCVAVVYATVN